MKILIAGASGFIGKELATFLQKKGHRVISLVRDLKKSSSHAFFWSPEKGKIDLSAFAGVDAVINLSGENISSRRWTALQKQKIFESRLLATRTLAEALCKLENPPRLFISASAIGIYGNSGDVYCNENSEKGAGFLSDVCAQWEEAAKAVSLKGVSTLIFRFGVVLSPDGGALHKMLPFFRWGLGGILGSGKQYLSWIAIDDLLAIFLFALTDDHLKGGIVNLVSPYPVTNREFTKTLGRVLHRPTWFKVPSFLLHCLFGEERADALFLTSTRVEPLRLKLDGYVFQYPTIEKALNHLIICYQKKLDRACKRSI